MIKKAWLNYFIDIGLLISFILCGVTGIIKWPGIIPKIGLNYSNLPFVLISKIHDWSGLLIVILSLIHVILHWKWIVKMTKRLFRGVGR